MAEVYQFRIFIRHISPAIWRRVQLRSDQTLEDLHHTLQLVMGWSDFHLHRFVLRGRYYDREWREKEPLSSFNFRHHERFLYEYDFGDWWQLEIRFEKVLSQNPKKVYPLCVGGKRAGPPEDCGGPFAFMALEDHYSLPYMFDIILQIVDGELSRDDYREELHEFQYWLKHDQFTRRPINRKLMSYGEVGDEWRWH